MTPERAKKLRDSLNWDYDPDCFCGLCTEYRDGLDGPVGFGGASPPGTPRPYPYKPDERQCAPVKLDVDMGRDDRTDAFLFSFRGLRADELGRNRKLRQYTSAERNEIPLHTVLAEYFPDAFAALARHAKKANVKHNGPEAPMAWAREKSTDHLNKAVRHITTPDNVDPDTGEIELVGAFWRIGAALQLREEKRLTGLGIMPLSGRAA